MTMAAHGGAHFNSHGVRCRARRAAGLERLPRQGRLSGLLASWCAPCRRSFPWLDGLVSEYAKRDLVVIGVNVDQDHSLAEQFLNAGLLAKLALLRGQEAEAFLHGEQVRACCFR